MSLEASGNPVRPAGGITGLIADLHLEVDLVQGAVPEAWLRRVSLLSASWIWCHAVLPWTQLAGAKINLACFKL